MFDRPSKIIWYRRVQKSFCTWRGFRHNTKLELLKRSASRGVTLTALMSIIGWNIRFPDSSKSFSVIANLALQHDLGESYTILFNLSGEENAPVLYSELRDNQSRMNSALENFTSIIQPTEDWFDELSDSNDYELEGCWDPLVIFEMILRLLPNSKCR